MGPIRHGQVEIFTLSALFNLTEQRKKILSHSSLVLHLCDFSHSRWKWMRFTEHYGIKEILNNIFCLWSSNDVFELKQSMNDMCLMICKWNCDCNTKQRFNKIFASKQWVIRTLVIISDVARFFSITIIKWEK